MSDPFMPGGDVDQAYQLSEILGIPPAKLLAMSSEQLMQLPMTQDQFDQVAQLVGGGTPQPSSDDDN